MPLKSWEEIASAKRAELLNSIPSQWRLSPNDLPPSNKDDVTTYPYDSGVFSEIELAITDSNASDILKSIHSGRWHSVQVTQAFCKRAAISQQLVNCLSVCMFEDALKRAQELDDYFARYNKPIGPLHGLPVSLKDNFNVKNYDSTVGFVAFANDPASENSTLVEILKEAGAVLYCKTNVPTAMMIAETVNNLFGRTVNPRNRQLTSGGSSGGESALIACGGSCLGIGTDIGGSLRIPASLSGIFALRPSFGRFPTQGARSGLAGQEAVNSVNGPLSASLEALSLFSKAIVDTEPWRRDPKCLPIPWRKIERKQRLRLAVCWNDGLVTPTPPVARALRESVSRLKSAGHEVVEWDPKLHAEAAGILARMFLADGGKSVKAILTPVKEPFREEMRAYSTAIELGVHAMWQLQLERNALCKSFLEQWNTLKIDGILCPTTPHAAVRNGQFGSHVGYTGVFNLVDYSCVSFPTGLLVDKAKDQLSPEAEPLSDKDQETMKQYDVEVIHGMPISLQIVARRLEEEKVLMMTKTILDAHSTSSFT